MDHLHPRAPLMNLSPSRTALPARAFLRLAPLALVLVAISGVGCFRATGVSRPSIAVEEIPPTGGDRVAGLKATAGPGDYYLGNDYVQLAIDGASLGAEPGQFGAPGGGAILDVGTVALDQSYKRVSIPGDMLERLGPVINQDPDLPLAFTGYSPGTGTGVAYLDMTGYLLDPKGKLGVPLDAQGRVIGVSVTHRISLQERSTYFTLETTLANNGTASLPIYNRRMLPSLR